MRRACQMVPPVLRRQAARRALRRGWSVVSSAPRAVSWLSESAQRVVRPDARERAAVAPERRVAPFAARSVRPAGSMPRGESVPREASVWPEESERDVARPGDPAQAAALLGQPVVSPDGRGGQVAVLGGPAEFAPRAAVRPALRAFARRVLVAQDAWRPEAAEQFAPAAVSQRAAEVAQLVRADVLPREAAERRVPVAVLRQAATPEVLRPEAARAVVPEASLRAPSELPFFPFPAPAPGLGQAISGIRADALRCFRLPRLLTAASRDQEARRSSSAAVAAFSFAYPLWEWSQPHFSASA